jgi:membrane-bound transcription factor site-1 protease
VPALNELLEPYGVAFGDMVLEGQLPELAGDSPWYASGANIVKWPAAGWLHAAVLTDKATQGAACSSPRHRLL